MVGTQKTSTAASENACRVFSGSPHPSDSGNQLLGLEQDLYVDQVGVKLIAILLFLLPKNWGEKSYSLWFEF